MHRLPLFCAAAMACLLGGATLCVPVQAAEEHYYTLIAADKTSATFAEDSARRFRDGTIRLSVLRVFDGGAIAYSNTQMMLTCATSKAQTLEGMTYSRDGKKIPTAAEAEATAAARVVFHTSERLSDQEPDYANVRHNSAKERF